VTAPRGPTTEVVGILQSYSKREFELAQINDLVKGVKLQVPLGRP